MAAETVKSSETAAEPKPVGMMDAKELHKHIEDADATHKKNMKHWKNLLRCLPGGLALLGET
jgi:hypothetical protein